MTPSSEIYTPIKFGGSIIRIMPSFLSKKMLFMVSFLAYRLKFMRLPLNLSTVDSTTLKKSISISS
jgi:hypothetical protein